MQKPPLVGGFLLFIAGCVRQMGRKIGSVK